MAAVHYPGLTGFAGRERHFSQAEGAGAVLSFILRDPQAIPGVLQRVKLPIIAPSLGGVETILTHCWSMSHVALPAALKESLGIVPGLLRLSAGIEAVEDLWRDLEEALPR